MTSRSGMRNNDDAFKLDEGREHFSSSSPTLPQELFFSVSYCTALNLLRNKKKNCLKKSQNIRHDLSDFDTIITNWHAYKCHHKLNCI